MLKEFKNYTLEIKDTGNPWNRTCLLKQDNNLVTYFKEDDGWHFTIPEIIYNTRQKYLRKMKESNKQIDYELNDYLRKLEANT